jgi:hypothetical protein
MENTFIKNDTDAFVKILGKNATPYVEFLESMTNEGEIWEFEVRPSSPIFSTLTCRYGNIFLVGKDKDIDERVARSLKIRREIWKSLLSKTKPTPEEIYNIVSVHIWENMQESALYDLMIQGNLEHLTDEEYWKLVIDVWVLAGETTETSHSGSCWKELFEEREPDQSTTKDLPEEINIYRGGDVNGWSWSLSLETAIWFANRWGTQKDIWETTIQKTNILFYTNEREEDEVLLRTLPDPDKIERVVVREKDAA